ncbi:MAG: alpha/beta fold hydrolase [Deltaproteobacteria bacterium]|nr:alpha/beta fold hydrolase [Deltaproteobacteria bacterium]
MPIEAFRTPDDAFADLPGYGFKPRYVEELPGYEGLRMHYLDEGPKGGDVVLCLHGEPSWSYLYRKMIPVFTAAGYRVIAPDFFGFGRSDKPVADEVYTYGFHRGSLLRFLDHLGLNRFTLVCQDWGGILGLSLPVDRPDAITRLIVMNTAIPTGEISPGKGFLAWRDFVANQPDFDVVSLMKRGTPGLTDEEAAAYGAPFDGPRSKAGVRTFPALVPISTDMAGAETGKKALAFWANEWSGPTFMAVGMQDPVLGPPAMKLLRSQIRGCPAPLEIEDAGHFVQERGDVVAKAALEHFGG